MWPSQKSWTLSSIWSQPKGQLIWKLRTKTPLGFTIHTERHQFYWVKALCVDQSLRIYICLAYQWRSFSFSSHPFLITHNFPHELWCRMVGGESNPGCADLKCQTYKRISIYKLCVILLWFIKIWNNCYCYFKFSLIATKQHLPQRSCLLK